MKKHEEFLYQEIAESLRRRIASGELKPGDKIPPVREMAQHWGCTPGTVGKAYAQLRDEGLLSSHRGGGTRVAPNALQPEEPAWNWANLINRAEQFLLEAIRRGHTPPQAMSALTVAISRWQDLQSADSAPSQTESTGQVKALRFAGSHDLAIELMAQMLRDNKPSTELSIEYLGSLGGLMALARGEADIAGIHLWDEKTDTYNLPFVQRVLPSRQATLLTLAHRSLGLIVPRGNPQKLDHLGDLGRPDVRLVNRQAGSGTRVWLDAQLKALGIFAERVSGYEREELTHLAVARAVHQGEATVGLGIHAAAVAFDLDFLPLTQERYDLVFLDETWNTPKVQALAETIRSSRFKEALADLGGYDTAKTGQETKTN